MAIWTIDALRLSSAFKRIGPVIICSFVGDMACLYRSTIIHILKSKIDVLGHVLSRDGSYCLIGRLITL